MYPFADCPTALGRLEYEIDTEVCQMKGIGDRTTANTQRLLDRVRDALRVNPHYEVLLLM